MPMQLIQLLDLKNGDSIVWNCKIKDDKLEISLEPLKALEFEEKKQDE